MLGIVADSGVIVVGQTEIVMEEKWVQGNT